MPLRDVLERDRALNPPASQPQPQPAPPPGPMGVGEDMARSGVSGLYDGGVTGLIGGFGDIGQMGRDGLSYVYRQMGMSPEAADRAAAIMVNRAPLAAFPNTRQLEELKPDAVDHKPETVPGDIAYRAGVITPSVALAPGGGGIVSRGLSVLGSALGGHYGKQGAEKVADFVKVPEKYRGYAGVAGDIVGTVAGGMTPDLIKKLITPNPMEPDRRALAKVLEDNNVEMTAGQKTGNEVLHYKESQTGGTAYSNLKGRQKDQYTSGALELGGLPPAPAATPEVFAKQHRILGQEFDRLQNYGLDPDSQLFSDLVDVRDKYYSITAKSQRAPIIEKVAKDVYEKSQQNVTVSGEWVKSVGSDLRAARDSAVRSGDSALAGALSDLIDVIDEGVERTILKKNPTDANAYSDVRKKYRNLLKLEEAAARDPAGNVSPASLIEAEKKFETRRGYSRGRGTFNKYARAGKVILTEPPQSGTANRLSAAIPALKQFGSTPAMLGTIAGYLLGNGPGAAVGAGLGMAVDGGVNYARMTPAMQAYLSNQLLSNWETASGAVRAGAAGQARAKQMSMEK